MKAVDSRLRPTFKQIKGAEAISDKSIENAEKVHAKLREFAVRSELFVDGYQPSVHSHISKVEVLIITKQG